MIEFRNILQVDEGTTPIYIISKFKKKKKQEKNNRHVKLDVIVIFSLVYLKQLNPQTAISNLKISHHHGMDIDASKPAAIVYKGSLQGNSSEEPAFSPRSGIQYHRQAVTLATHIYTLGKI